MACSGSPDWSNVINARSLRKFQLLFDFELNDDPDRAR
jgi:hypothetical protein